MKRLGDILIAQGALRRDELEAAVMHARGRLGDFLRAYGLIGPRQLAQAIAQQQALSYVDLGETPPDPALFRTRDIAHYLEHRYLPFNRRNGLLTIACCDPSDELRRVVERHTGYRVTMCVTSARDMNTTLARLGGPPMTRRAQHQLRRTHRGLSAAHTMLPHQRRGLWIILALLIAVLCWDMERNWNLLLMACNLFYFVSLAFKWQLYNQGKIAARVLRRLEKKLVPQVAALQVEHLPIYSILVPIYQESAAVMQRLIDHLDALDYPKEKLDIKLICEADDTTTVSALRALRPPETMQILTVPKSRPRTKPKACNVALQQIRGEYLVIYDAEDAPAPDQLKRAVVMFMQGSADLACLQAPLNYYNRNENLLTQLFALEYSTLFRLLLPALERMALPMPLGGTSNHLRISALNAAGGWDAFNVTEDADLGVRLAYLGYRTRMLPSITLEEAPITLRAWMGQRTRWIKGYIQTWLVYMRDPVTLKKRLGARAYYGFQFFIGAPALTFLLAPILWGVFLLAPLGLLPTRLSSFMLAICGISFVGGMVSHLLFAQAAIRLERWHGMQRAMLVYPLYWLLHSIACARALWQLARAPHYWAKTRHGVSAVFR